MSQHVKMSVKGQVVIPKDVRDALGWPQGVELDVIKGRDSVTLRPKSKKRKTLTIEEFRKLVPPYEGAYVPESEWRGAIEQMFREEWGQSGS
jgi:AbrB family looped-hinge helix DNA binding protein